MSHKHLIIAAVVGVAIGWLAADTLNNYQPFTAVYNWAGSL